MKENNIHNLPLWQFNNLLQYSTIIHFTTSRKGGISKELSLRTMNMSYTVGDDPVHVRQNREKVASAFGISIEKMLFPRQVHEDKILIIDKKFDFINKEKNLQGIDAMITNEKNVCLCIKCADCVPMIFFDPKLQVIAAVHSGWRGTMLKIAGKTIHQMKEFYHCNPADIIATIGPSIGPDSYEVGDEVVSAVNSIFPEYEKKLLLKKEEKIFFNLWEANRIILINEGVLDSNIEIAGICTYQQSSDFYSHRASNGNAGRFVTAVMLK